MSHPTLVPLPRARCYQPLTPHRAHGVAMMAMMAMMAGCLDDTTTARPAQKTSQIGEAGGLLIVATDYESTSLSWVDPNQRSVLSANFLHSGSAVSRSGSTFSGDVVAGSERLSDGRFPVIDRSHSTVTWVGGAEVVQWPVSDGFSANPQDVWQRGDEIFVVRAQPDPTPTKAPLSGGDDVLVLDMKGKAVARIPLSAESTLQGGMAFAGRGVKLGDQLWLPIASLSQDFTNIGPGRVISVDLAKRAVHGRVALPTLQNCTTLRATGSALIGTCSGFFQDKEAAQIAHSGVFRLEPGTGDVKVVLQAKSVGGVIGFPLEQDGLKRGWVIRLGQLSAPARADEVWQFDLLGSEPPRRIWTGSRGFAIGGLWFDSAQKRLWLTDAGDPAGDLVVLDLSEQTANQAVAGVTHIKTLKGGLPAVHLARVGGAP